MNDELNFCVILISRGGVAEGGVVVAIGVGGDVAVIVAFVQ